MVCLYHGTVNKENAAKILKEGFNNSTYFTQYLDTAIIMGGPYVFKISFDNLTEGDLKNGWQWRITGVTKDDILWLRVFSNEILYKNKDLSDSLRKKSFAHRNPGKQICDKCDGRGQLEIYDEYESQWGLNLPRTICDKCNSYGVLDYFGGE